MPFFGIIQVVYLFLNLAGTAVMVMALVNVLGWPEFRSRGLFLAAVGLKAAVGIGYVFVRAVSAAGLLAHIGGSSGELMQAGYVLLALLQLLSDGLLLAAVISLGGVLRAMYRARQTAVPTPPPTSGGWSGE